MDQCWGVGISGGSVECGNLTPDREALIYFGSPLGRAEPMPSWSKVRGDAAKGRQEPLGMPHRFKAFHRPFALSGGLMRVLGAIVQIFQVAQCSGFNSPSLLSWLYWAKAAVANSSNDVGFRPRSHARTFGLPIKLCWPYQRETELITA